MKKIALSLMGTIAVLTMMFGAHTTPTTDSKQINAAVQNAHGDTG
ncbi:MULTISPECIES: Phr family secreted Rap phosphatase inhibitor [Bacillus]|nr:Phr family secreted Rap phosphatase inhibitor [Bacillus pseudomycoides]MED4714254.1 Phr family secreted Rap phosphatase inhibitor [Bacillus pseudomycoides]